MILKDMISQLEQALAETRGNLVQSTGGASVCSIHKHGKPSDFLKYNEGKEFVVRRTIGLLRQDASAGDIHSFLSASADKFHKYKSSETTASSAWQAYADGGLEGIALIKATLNMR